MAILVLGDFTCKVSFMFTSLGHIAGRPQLLVLALMLFAQGSAYGATIPYFSVTAIGTLGMSDLSYSVLLFGSSVAAVTISVSLGILSDMMGDRRQILMALALAGTVGYGAVYAFPSIVVFVLASTFVIPFFYATSSLLFSSARVETSAFDPVDAAGVNVTLRAFVSAAWVVTPAALGFALAAQGNMLSAWGLAALFAFAILLAAGLILKPQPARQATDPKPPGFFAALKELGAPSMLIRIAAMASMTATLRLNGTVWPLIMTVELGGSTSDIGVISGLTALLEIPFMLIWAASLKRFGMTGIIVATALLYAGYMALLGIATAPWHIYALALPGAAAAAALLTLPLTYFQELFPGRPGFGTAFLPIVSFLANALSAAAFAIGSHFFDYSGTVWMGACLSIAGVFLLLSAERRYA